jgi:hypothetical protein
MFPNFGVFGSKIRLFRAKNGLFDAKRDKIWQFLAVFGGFFVTISATWRRIAQQKAMLSVAFRCLFVFSISYLQVRFKVIYAQR